jgi:23S rRNA C2498 (ribose-2'-O)-methylase RlmM
VSSHLTSHPGFQELEQFDASCAAELVGEIANKASGVFLWVMIVVQSLLEGLRDADRLSDLRKRLDGLPDELEELFRRILDNLDPNYIRHASKLFQIFRSAICPSSLLCLSSADEQDDNFAIRAEVKPLAATQLLYKMSTMKRRLYS